MGNVVLEFYGLFLFDSRTAGTKRIAVIDGDAVGKSHKGKMLTRHKAWFDVTSKETPNSDDWPSIGFNYEVKGRVSFSASPKPALTATDWQVLAVREGCSNLDLSNFFDNLEPGRKQAFIDLDGGTLCSFKYGVSAIGSRLTLANVTTFSLERADGKAISYQNLTDDVRIRFHNREARGGSDDDWLWYYKAADSDCAPEPKDVNFKHTCKFEGGDVDLLPFTLGCSNSNWP